MSDFIVINDDLRTMDIPDSTALLGVESDDDVNVIQFKMPKVYKGFDLSTFEARVNYMNAGGEGDLYIADDLSVDPEDNTKMTFSWLVGRNACKYKGRTQFIVCMKLFANDNSGTVLKEFNTTVYSLPVLEGLETSDAVVQENPDIIEYILRCMRESGVIDPDDYYTKAQINSMIPSRLPNPQKLTLNGYEYDGTAPVSLNISGNNPMLATASGKMLHVVDAIEYNNALLVLKDSNNDTITQATIAVTGKNMLKADTFESSVTTKGVTFDTQADGSVICSGTSNDTFAATTGTVDKQIFEIGRTYTLSSGKVLGFAYVQLLLTFADSTMQAVISKNAPATFTISKAVTSCVASVMVAELGVTVDNEVLYPQLEVGTYATLFEACDYEEVTYDGTQAQMLVQLEHSVSNIWALTDGVANMLMSYDADLTERKIAEYVAENIVSLPSGARLVAIFDGVDTVTLGLE